MSSGHEAELHVCIIRASNSEVSKGLRIVCVEMATDIVNGSKKTMTINVIREAT